MFDRQERSLQMARKLTTETKANLTRALTRLELARELLVDVDLLILTDIEDDLSRLINDLDDVLTELENSDA